MKRKLHVFSFPRKPSFVEIRFPHPNPIPFHMSRSKSRASKIVSLKSIKISNMRTAPISNCPTKIVFDTLCYEQHITDQLYSVSINGRVSNCSSTIQSDNIERFDTTLIFFIEYITCIRYCWQVLKIRLTRRSE